MATGIQKRTQWTDGLSHKAWHRTVAVVKNVKTGLKTAFFPGAAGDSSGALMQGSAPPGHGRRGGKLSAGSLQRGEKE